MALSFDSAAGTRPTDNTTLHGATTSTTLSMNTSGTDRIVLVFVMSQTSTTARTFTVSATGLTFALRKQFQYVSETSSFQGNMEIWWAYASAQLTAKTINISLSAASDSSVCAAVAISGVQNFTNPWDTNVSLPATNKNESGTASTASVTGVSTSQANSMVIGFFSSGNVSSQTITANTGYTNLIGSTIINSSGATNDSEEAVEEQVFSSTQSSITVAFANSSTQAWWGMIADAITADLATSSGNAAACMMMGVG